MAEVEAPTAGVERYVTNAGAAPVAVDATVSADLDKAVAEADEPEGTEGVESEPAEVEIAAPASLNAEGKAMFATLPPEQQKWWAETETTRARQVTEATTRAANREREAVALHQRAEAEAKGVYARQLMTFLAAQQPREPDPTHYHDINEYNQARAAFQQQAGQFGQLVQQVQALGAEAQQGLQGLSEEARQNETRVLQAAFPEWFDEAKGPEHKERLTAVGTDLGYTPELMANADAKDILALRVASEWKEKASKYDRLMSQRMAQVRKGGGSVPPNARGAAVGGQTTPVSTAAALYPNDVRR